MKKQISFLSIIFTLSIFTLILISCAKEELLPVNASNKIVSESTPAFTDLQNEFQDEQGSEIKMTYEEALESIDPDARPEWGVAIKAFTCIRSGESLLVYNPYNPSLDFYDSRRFIPLWFKDGKPVRGNRVRLECACKGEYAAVVLNRATQQGIGIAFYRVGSCYADGTQITDN